MSNRFRYWCHYSVYVHVSWNVFYIEVDHVETERHPTEKINTYQEIAQIPACLKVLTKWFRPVYPLLLSILYCLTLIGSFRFLNRFHFYTLIFLEDNLVFLHFFLEQALINNISVFFLLRDWLIIPTFELLDFVYYCNFCDCLSSLVIFSFANQILWTFRKLERSYESQWLRDSHNRIKGAPVVIYKHKI